MSYDISIFLHQTRSIVELPFQYHGKHKWKIRASGTDRWNAITIPLLILIAAVSCILLLGLFQLRIPNSRHVPDYDNGYIGKNFINESSVIPPVIGATKHFDYTHKISSSEIDNIRSLLLTTRATSRRVIVSTPLRPIDLQKFTIRMNTWRRNELLLISVRHYLTCSNVAMIHIVWCHDTGNVIPEALLQLQTSDRVMIEKHATNSLNERFRVLIDSPTRGILSMDDDVLRPCVALDAGFYLWTTVPDRMVGYDYRVHRASAHCSSERNDNDKHEHNATCSSYWAYGFASFVEHTNKYSMTLTRFAFVHVEYMKLYTTQLPRRMYDFISDNFNCEDVAMTLFVSALTDGGVPLLADYWAIMTQLKLYVEEKISGNDQHRVLRNRCVNDFSFLLGLKKMPSSFQEEELKNDVNNEQYNQLSKNMFQPVVVWRNIYEKKKNYLDYFRIGVKCDEEDEKYLFVAEDWYEEGRKKLVKMCCLWRERGLSKEKYFHHYIRWRIDKYKENVGIKSGAIIAGLVQNTPEWHQRWDDKGKLDY